MAHEPTFNELLRDAMIRHQIGIQRFSSSVRNQIWALLDATEKDLKRQIRSATRIGIDTPARVKSLNRLLAQIRKTRQTAWAKVNRKWFEEMNAFAIVEPEFLDRILLASVPGVELGTLLPADATMRKIVTSHPFMGKTLSEWSAKLEADDIARIENAIKIGLVQNETLPEISRRVVGEAALAGGGGMTQITRTHAASIVRTVTNGIGAEARRAYAEENVELAPFEVFTATLDSRTTLICQRFDGQRFRVGEGPRLPLHFGERSIRIPVLDGEVIGERPRRAFTQRQLVREFGKANDLKVNVPRGATSKAARAAIPRGHKGAFDAFARKRMRELTGPTPAATTYQQFLKSLSAAQQDDILGPTRGSLFRRGGLTLDKFVEINGRELTLAELAERHSSAFLKANLDPTAFK